MQQKANYLSLLSVCFGTLTYGFILAEFVPRSVHFLMMIALAVLAVMTGTKALRMNTNYQVLAKLGRILGIIFLILFGIYFVFYALASMSFN